MLVVFKNIEQKNILVFDAEYNEGDLIQFAAILFRKIEKDVYQICKSTNFYVKLENKNINPFIERFTGITDKFLNEYGISLSEAKESIVALLDHVDDFLLVSHGLRNDRLTLENNEIDFYDMPNKIIYPYCTYNNAKRILKRDKKLSLEDIANEAGIFLSNTHNAFDDTWATVAVFSLLCKLDSEENE